MKSKSNKKGYKKQQRQQIIDALTKRTLLINKVEFCAWYFSDTTREIEGNALINELISKGEVTETLLGILERVGYIPIRLVINKEYILQEDIDAGEISDPNDTYKIVFKEK
mgnify:CR=1 FL=1